LLASEGGLCSIELIILIPWSRDFVEKLIVTHVVKKFPAITETRRFITVFKRAHHQSLS
jgi:hypothetical protein